MFYRRLLAPSTAPIAARPVWGASSETTAPSSANLRQQGVDKSLFVLGGTLVAAFIHYPPDARRAVQATDVLHVLGEFNSRFCGALELDSISPAEIFSSTVHGAFFLIRKAGLPRERKRSGSRGKRTSSGMSERRRLGRCERYGACEDAASLRSRPLGRWARGRSVLWAAPTPNTGTRSGAPSSAAPFGD